jgi:hypothetical protein
MRKFILTLMASLLSCSAASAFWPEATCSSLEVGVGYRNDSIKWKREFSPESLYGSSSSHSGSSSSGFKDTTHLDWKNLNIWLIEARGTYITCDCIYLRGSADYGWITSGKFKHRNDFNTEFGSNYGYGNDFDQSRDKSHIKGNVYDVKLAVGYQFKWCDEALSVAPLVGYSWQGHELRNGNHDDSYSSGSYDPSYGHSDYYSYYTCDSDRSSSSYQSYSNESSGHKRHKLNDRWNGFFIGFDLDYRFCCDWNFFVDYEYHWADFHAHEHGNDNEFFNRNFDDSFCGCLRHRKSHIHSSNAYGNVLDFGVEWDLCECWVVGLRAEFQWWKAKKAHERTKVFEDSFGDSEEAEVVFKRRIKDVTWNSGSIILDLGMVF